MPMKPPAAVGMPLAEVDTPALVIDLDAFERNLRRMADFVGKAGIRLRPHAKTHKSPNIAAKQMALGAVGVCCQKVSEAEVMVAGGIGDVLVSNEVAGAAKLDRLAALARRPRSACASTMPPTSPRWRRPRPRPATCSTCWSRSTSAAALRHRAGRAGRAHRRAGRPLAASALRRPAGLSRLGTARA